MKHNRLMTLVLLLPLWLAGCTAPSRNDDDTIYDGYTEMMERERSHHKTPGDFWQMVLDIEDSIKVVNCLGVRLSDSRLLWYIDSLFARYEWNVPAYQCLEGGLYDYLYGDSGMGECRFSMKEPKSYRYFPIWQEYIIWKKSEAVQKELSNKAIPIDIAEEYRLLCGYKAAACGLLEVMVNEVFAEYDSVDYWLIVYGERYYWEEITDLYGEMLRLLVCYDGIANQGKIDVQYRPIDPRQFVEAFRWLKDVSSDRREASKRVEEAYYAWMDYRERVSRKLTGKAKTLYNNATYRLQFALLIEIKNQFEHCGQWDVGVEDYTLSKRGCSYKKLLEFKGAKQAMEALWGKQE